MRTQHERDGLCRFISMSMFTIQLHNFSCGFYDYYCERLRSVSPNWTYNSLPEPSSSSNDGAMSRWNDTAKRPNGTTAKRKVNKNDTKTHREFGGLCVYVCAVGFVVLPSICAFRLAAQRPTKPFIFVSRAQFVFTVYFVIIVPWTSSRPKRCFLRIKMQLPRTLSIVHTEDVLLHQIGGREE